MYRLGGLYERHPWLEAAVGVSLVPRPEPDAHEAEDPTPGGD